MLGMYEVIALNIIVQVLLLLHRTQWNPVTTKRIECTAIAKPTKKDNNTGPSKRNEC